MSEQIRLSYLTPGLNGSAGLIRQHFRNAAKLKERLIWDVKSQRRGPTISQPVRVTYTRYTASLMDWDNACASFKHIGDALTAAGVLADDSPKIIAEFLPRQVKCKRDEQRTEILIEKIQP